MTWFVHQVEKLNAVFQNYAGEETSAGFVGLPAQLKFLFLPRGVAGIDFFPHTLKHAIEGVRMSLRKYFPFPGPARRSWPAMRPVIMHKGAALMTITLDIKPEIEAELAATARVRGLSAEQYARQVMGLGNGQKAPCSQNPQNLGLSTPNRNVRFSAR
jgi:hypothetical protein